MLFLLFALFSLLTNETGSVITRVDYLYFQGIVLEKTLLFNTDQMRIFDPSNIWNGFFCNIAQRFRR